MTIALVRVLLCVTIVTVVLFSGFDRLETAGEGARTAVEAAFINGKIYTMDVDRPEAEAVALGGGRILFVGESRDIIAKCGPGTRKYDLEGRTVIPGLIDAHAHFLGYALGRANIDLVGTGSFGEVLEKVTERVGESGEGEWIIGRGWDQNDWADSRYPDRWMLDQAAPENPVCLTRVCGHAVVVNSSAMRFAGITKSTPDPPGGKIMHDESGEPTGILIDEAKRLVTEVIPPVGRERKKALLREAANLCLASGLVGVHEMGISGETASIYRELFGDERLPFRITAYFDVDDKGLDSLLSEGPMRGFADGRFSVIGVKMFADGSLGARSAALIDDYSDDPGNRGILVTDPKVLDAKAELCHEAGFQVAVHAIGDRANRIVLDIYERILDGGRGEDRRHRIEHAQVVSPEDIIRFSALGVIPSMQFTHCTSDMPWAGDRLGPERIRGAYAWRSLLDTGCRIPGGSDFPVESIDPLLGIYAAVTRRDLGGGPESGWMSEQCLTVHEAVRSFTLDAAYAVHAEDRTGSLEPGKYADLIVLSDNIMEIDPVDIPGIEIEATVLGGEIAWRRDGYELSILD